MFILELLVLRIEGPLLHNCHLYFSIFISLFFIFSLFFLLLSGSFSLFSFGYFLFHFIRTYYSLCSQVFWLFCVCVCVLFFVLRSCSLLSTFWLEFLKFDTSLTMFFVLCVLCSGTLALVLIGWL